MTQKYEQVWDLDSIFPGGSESNEFQGFLENLETELKQFQKDLDEADHEVKTWAAMVVKAQEIGKKVRESGAFISCLSAQNVKDEGAKMLTGRIKQLSSLFSSVMTSIDEQLLAFDDQKWQQFTELDDMKEIIFNLN